MESYHPIELLEGIFYFYPENTFENDRETIHTAFYNLRRNNFDLFREMTFRKNILFPRSQVLDELLWSLQPGFLEKTNTTYEIYQIKKDNLQKLWDNELKDKFSDKEDTLRGLAKELNELMSNKYNNNKRITP